MTVIGSRYEVLEELGMGGMGVVYLVYDKLRAQKVALKKVLVSEEEQRLAITREFRTLSTLRHPNIVSVIEYGSHENQPYFTMEYLPDSIAFDKQDGFPDQKIQRTIQMLQALGYLHRRGILHRDLKPGNVLVTVDGTVKVLDFGIARDTFSTRTSSRTDAMGTMSYMAPELFMDEPASVGSDLWAVGVMICEVLTGHHPFEMVTPARLMMSIVGGSPNLRGMDEALSVVVSRLLSRDSAKRYPSASDVIRELCAAAHMPVPPESHAQRESFLQAAAFVGRQHEYQCLVDALHESTSGKGQLWIIGGEAGVGKSRLLDEVRTRALVSGFTVLQGQGVEGGGLPFQLWRDPARKLILGTPISELTASVLKALVPDIGSLLDRDIEDVPPLDPKANRDRLMAALLERLRELASPVLMILEDLHWTRESFDLLKLLVPHIAELPVMIIGSYRPDEKPHLVDELPDVKLLTLERLDDKAVAALSISMIGADAATPELVERLAHETEGNALFMVEIVRALAEEAGSLQNINGKALPEKILTGGITAIMKRRLAKVPAWALDTLKLAAVIGRMVDEEVLGAAGIRDLNHWLQICTEAAVLEPYSGEWRFSHDRLRHVLLREFPADELSLLHTRAAQAIESIYRDDVRYAQLLAQHWHSAGNAEREVYFILKSAEHLVTISGDYAQADVILQRGLEVNLPPTRAELLLWLGTAAEKQGRYGDAVTAYQSALESQPSAAIHASLLNRFSSVSWQRGKYTEANDYARQAQVVAEQHQDRRNIALSFNSQGIVAGYQRDYAAARTYFEDSLRIRREIGDRWGIAVSLNNLGAVADYQGNHAAARKYFEDSLLIQREIGERRGIAVCLHNLGEVAASQGDYTAAQTYFDGSLHIRRQIGDSRGIASTLTGLGSVVFQQGLPAAAQTYLEDSLRIRRQIGDRQGIAENLNFLGALADHQGDHPAAYIHYGSSLALYREIGDREGIITATIGLVIVLVQVGDFAPAREHLTTIHATARELDTVPSMLRVLLGAGYWVQAHHQHEKAALWIGLMAAQGEAKFKDDTRFKRLMEKVETGLGKDRFDAAVERGKLLDVRDVMTGLLDELFPQNIT